MKKIVKFFFCFFLILLFVSCRNDSAEVQKIDQGINIYIKNANGVDLLNPKLNGSYTTIGAQDLNAAKALQSISGITVKKDKDTVSYLEYYSGAVRVLKDSISPSQKVYQSDFYLNLSKTINNNIVTDVDTVSVEYSWSPSVFQVSKIWCNQKLAFTKIDGQANIIKIVK